ncbi:hypothetical protein [Salinibacterium sp. NK8237]|uniref:hypothetical protein n=1 Tax=Salinibacterium sp. NK8237 TaxID=2792038 RepID=UPI0018CCA13B|nr:hypothetical protein [Salinibacterium sp. NK8237]MBH0129510.1 hypothetical protein [Salinibacterium sp. NK8237]
MSAVATDGVLVWGSALWLIAIIAIIVIGLVSRHLPMPADGLKVVHKRKVAPKGSRDQKIAFAVGWTLVTSTLTFMFALFFVPPIMALVALFSWPQSRIDNCEEDPLCVISILDKNALPVWVAFLWVAIVVAAMVICWKPARWCSPPTSEARRAKVRPYTSPFWIRTYAIIIGLVALLSITGLDTDLDDVYSLEYVWVVLAAGTIVAITMVNIRIHGVKGPGEW